MGQIQEISHFDTDFSGMFYLDAIFHHKLIKLPHLGHLLWMNSLFERKKFHQYPWRTSIQRNNPCQSSEKLIKEKNYLQKPTNNAHWLTLPHKKLLSVRKTAVTHLSAKKLNRKQGKMLKQVTTVDEKHVNFSINHNNS